MILLGFIAMIVGLRKMLCFCEEMLIADGLMLQYEQECVILSYVTDVYAMN